MWIGNKFNSTNKSSDGSFANHIFNFQHSHKPLAALLAPAQMGYSDHKQALEA
jgi:hypothetical protein